MNKKYVQILVVLILSLVIVLSFVIYFFNGSSNSGKAGFVELGKQYDEVADYDINEDIYKWIADVNGKLAYTAKKEGKWFVVYDGIEGKKYDAIGEVTDVGGKLTYVAINDFKEFVVFDGVEGKGYDEIKREQAGVYGGSGKGIFDVGGKPAYMAKEGNKEFIVHNNIESEIKYEDIGNIIDIEGKLVYLANYGNILVYDGKEIYLPSQIRKLMNINNSGYSSYIENIVLPSVFIVDDAVISGYLYSYRYSEPDESVSYNIEIGSFTDINGKIAYIFEKRKLYQEDRYNEAGLLIGNLKVVEMFVVTDGVEGKHYNSIKLLTNICGKVAYVVEEEDGEDFLVFDGVEGKHYYTIYNNITGLDCKPVYIAVDEGEHFIVIGDMEEKYYSGKFSGDIFLSNTININGKLAYYVLEPTKLGFDNKGWIVYDGKDIGKQYDSTNPPINIGGKLAFEALDNGKKFIVIEQ